jgi:hypothetical protein
MTEDMARASLRYSATLSQSGRLLDVDHDSVGTSILFANADYPGTTHSATVREAFTIDNYVFVLAEDVAGLWHGVALKALETVHAPFWMAEDGTVRPECDARKDEDDY